MDDTRDESINKLKIRGKHKEKWAKTRKKGHGGKHTRPKKWSGARRPAGPATTALVIVLDITLQAHTVTGVHSSTIYKCVSLNQW